MQLGFVQLLEPEIDLVFQSLMPQKTQHADFYRFWAKHFATCSSSSSVSVPPEWAAFFTTALMNPGSFEWAKKFLSSPAWAFFSASDPVDYPFILAAKCPTDASSSCLKESGTPPQNVSPSTGPWSKSLLAKAGKLCISEDDPELIRSNRKRSHNKGFKDAEKVSEKALLKKMKAPVPVGRKPVVKKKSKDGEDDKEAKKKSKK